MPPIIRFKIIAILVLFGNITKADEYVVEAEYSYASFRIPGKLDSLAMGFDGKIASFSREDQCVGSIKSRKSVSSALAKGIQHNLSDVVIRCRKYWTIQGCSPNLLTNETCIGMADVGSPHHEIIYLGDQNVDSRTLTQHISKDMRMKRGAHQVLQRTLVMKMGDGALLAVETKQDIFHPKKYGIPLGTKLSSCEEFINNPKLKTIIKEGYFRSGVEFIQMRCFNVHGNGSVDLSNSVNLKAN